MKLTHLALISVLSLPNAAWAGPKPFPVKNPGPYVLKKDQAACQNMLDYDELHGFQILDNKTAEAEYWARLGAPEKEAQNRLCIKLRKGWTVTVQKRPIGFECVTVKERPSSHCFWTGNVSGEFYKEPVYDGGVYLLD